MMKAKKSAGNERWPDASGSEEEDENDITQPIRIVCSRQPHSGQPRNPRARWLKQREESGTRRTPDWTEIGGKPRRRQIPSLRHLPL